MSDKYKRRDLLKYNIFKRIIGNRNTQPITQLLAFIPFIFVIVTGLIGVSLGAKNFSVVFTWILWSVLLTIILVPLLGRVWCLICPIVWPGELIQRKIWKKYGTSTFLNRKWPKFLQNVWLQNFLFLVFAIWMVVLVTQPFVTAIAVLILITSATIIFVFFPRRRFCLHLCPPGLFIGLYSTYSPVEVRIKEKDVCLQPSSEGGCNKECYTGSEKGYGCPWYEFPQNMVSNSDCGLCTECFKSCPKDNISLNIRPFNAELESREPKRKADEAWRSLILLALPLVYTGVLFGPWAWIKNWGDLLLYTTSVGFLQHIFYALLVIDISLGVIPGLHLLASVLSKRIGNVQNISIRKLFIEYAYAYIPLGLMFWVGFNFSLLLMEWSYIPVVMSDPFGAGWDLLGTTYLSWLPISLPIPILEIIFVFLGTFLSLRAGYSTLSRIIPDQKRAIYALTPFAVLTIIVSLVFLWFYI